MYEPSNAEIARHLDQITRQIEGIVKTLEQSYVRRDVYEAKHDALRSSVNSQIEDLRGDIAEVKKVRDEGIAFRRQILAGAAVGIILLLVNLALATSNLIARAGG